MTGLEGTGRRHHQAGEQAVPEAIAIDAEITLEANPDDFAADPELAFTPGPSIGFDNAAKAGDSRSGDAFLHRGIAARGFIRSFVLADGMVVEEASLEHGLLHIDLARPEPEKRVLRVPIRSRA